MGNAVVNGTVTVGYEYALHLPNGNVWMYSDLTPHAVPYRKLVGIPHNMSQLLIPIDIITAARLHLIKPGDDSGLGDEQWAWLRLIGLT